MLDFQFFSPTKVFFGRNQEDKVGSILSDYGFKKVLIHYGGGSVIKSGLLDRVKDSLTREAIDFVQLGGVVPNPRSGLVNQGIKLGQEEGVDFILAVGGGSVMDSAKAIGYGLANDFPIEDLFLARVETDKCLPIGCIPTLAASGSETSDSSVITLEEGNLKRSYGHDVGRPLFSIMNPELTYTLPAYQTSCGGVDIIMHTFERYFTPTIGGTDLVDGLSESLLKTIMASTKKALENPEDYEARANLLWGGTLSHNGLLGLGRDQDWACHRMEHELSGKYDVAHGAGLAALWPSWARYVYREDIKRFAQFAVNVMNIDPNFYDLEETALRGIDAMEAYFQDINMPTNLRELGIEDPSDQVIEEMANKCLDSVKGGPLGGFKKLYKEDIINIYKLAR